MSLRWLPNAISLMRIALVVPVVLTILEGRFEQAIIIFFVAGFSDGVDGWLAKRFNWHTRLGGILDPVADKLLVASAFVTLVCTEPRLVPLWLAAMVILRDVIIVGGATAYNFLVGPVEGEPTRVSKLNTAFELLYVLLVLCRAAFNWPPEPVLIVLGAAVLVTVVVSGIDYVWSWSRRAQGRAV